MRASKTVKIEKLVVWGGIRGDQTFGPYFFEGNVNLQNYLMLLRKFLVPELRSRSIALKEVCLQHDGATPHFAVKVRNYVDKTFPTCIGRGTRLAWPARSPDLTPMDFFLGTN